MDPTPAASPTTPPQALAPGDGSVSRPAAPPSLAPHADHGSAHAQWVVLGWVVAAYVLFWWAGHLLGVPAYRGYEASLLRQPTVLRSVGAVVAAGGLYLAVLAAGGVLTRRHWAYAAPLAASAGLAAWSFRGGPSRYVYLAPTNAAAGAGPFWALAAETVLLGAAVAAGWLWVLPRLIDRRDPAAGPPISPPGDSATAGAPDTLVLRAVLAQAALVGVAAAFLVPTDDKKQAALGVLSAALLGTAVCQHLFQSERLARWYWAGPLLAGLAGYALNAAGGGAAAAGQTGRLTGLFAALARPLPLDYAGAGVVGAILGYWIGSDHPVPAPAPTSANDLPAPSPADSHASPATM